MWQECVVMFSVEEYMNGDYGFSRAIMGEKCIIQVSHGTLQFKAFL